METTVITLIVTPILIPIITQYGIDPVHFGIIMMTIVTMGCSTPPVGVALYTCSNIMGCSVEETTRYSIPLFVAILCVLPQDGTVFAESDLWGGGLGDWKCCRTGKALRWLDPVLRHLFSIPS